MAELQPSKLATRVRFPSPAPFVFSCRSGEMADAADSKSAARECVRVRVPPPAPLPFIPLISCFGSATLLGSGGAARRGICREFQASFMEQSKFQISFSRKALKATFKQKLVLLVSIISGKFLFLMQRRDAPATKSSGCLSEANPKGRKGPRDAEFYKLGKLSILYHYIVCERILFAEMTQSVTQMVIAPLARPRKLRR